MAGIFDGYDLGQLQQGYQGFQSSQQQAQPAAAPAPSLLDRVGSFISGIPGAIAQPFQDIGRNVGYALGSGSILDQANRTNQMAGQTISQAKALWQQGKIDKNTYIHILSNVNDSLAQNTQNINELRQNVNAKQTLAAGAQVATYALAPELSALKPAAALGANAALGGVMGGASAIENGGNASDAARNALIGIGIGGGLSAAGGLIGRVLARRGAPAAAAATADTGSNLASDLTPEARANMLSDFRQQAAQAGPAVESPRGPITVSPSGAGNAASRFQPTAESNMRVINNFNQANAQADKMLAQTSYAAEGAPSAAAGVGAQAGRPADVQAFLDAWNSGDYRAVQGAIDKLKNPDLAKSMENMLVNRTMDMPGLAAPTAATDAGHITNFLQAYNSGDFNAARQAIQEANPNIRDTLTSLVDRQTVQPGSIEELQARTAGLANKFDQNQVARANLVKPAPMNLPPGYNMDVTGSVTAPSGKALTLGEVSQVDRGMPKFVRDFEQARSEGNSSVMSRINAAHPGDVRVELPGNAAVAPAKATRGNFLQRVGASMESDPLRLRLPGGVGTATKEAQAIQMLREDGLLKAGANSQTIHEGIDKLFTKMQGQIGDILKESDANIATTDLKAQIEGAIQDSDLAVSNPAAAEKLQNVLGRIVDDQADSSGKLSAVNLYAVKQDMQRPLSRAYAAMEKGNPITPEQQARMDVRDIVNNMLPPEARAIGQRESLYHDIAPVIARRAAKGAISRIPIVGQLLPHERGGEPALAHAVQSVKTGIGGGVAAVGNAQAAIGRAARSGILGRVGSGIEAGASKVPPLPPAASAALGTAGNYVPLLGAVGGANYQEPGSAPASLPPTPSATGPNGQPLDIQLAAAHLPAGNLGSELTSANPLPPQAAAASQGMYGVTSQDLEQAMLADAIYNNGANLSKLGTIHTILQNQEKAAMPQNLPQVAVNQVNMAQRAMSGLDQIEAAFGKAGGAGKGPISAVEGSALGNILPGGADVHNLNNVIQLSLAPIAAALGLPQNSAMLQNLAGQLPTQFDTQESAKAKLNVVRDQINQYLQQYLSNQSNLAQPNNSSLDALAQMSAGGLTQ